MSEVIKYFFSSSDLIFFSSKSPKQIARTAQIQDRFIAKGNTSHVFYNLLDFFEFCVDNYRLSCYNTKCSETERLLGGIAQLGERLTGSQEVSGSIPLISTRSCHSSITD